MGGRKNSVLKWEIEHQEDRMREGRARLLEEGNQAPEIEALTSKERESDFMIGDGFRFHQRLTPCRGRQQRCSVLDAFDADLKQQSGIPTRVLQNRIQRCTSLPRPPSRLWKQFVSCSVSQFWRNQHLIVESARRRSAYRGE